LAYRGQRSPRCAQFYFFAFRQIRFGFVAHNCDQISHGQIGIDKMQSPVLQHLSIHDDIARDVIGAHTAGAGMNRHGKIGAMFICEAFGAQEPRHFDKRGVDRLGRRRPVEWLSRAVGTGRDAARRQVRIQHTRAATQRSGIGAHRLHAIGRLAKARIGRRRDVGAEIRKRDHASGLAV
jgi:hypothetical protein